MTDQAGTESVEQENDRRSRVPPFATLHPFRLQVADGESSPRPVLVEYGFENRGFGKSSHEIPIMTKCTAAEKEMLVELRSWIAACHGETLPLYRGDSTPALWR